MHANYMAKTTEYLKSISVSLAEENDREATLCELEAFWHKQRKQLGLTVGYRELDHIGEILVQLRWAKDEQNEREFERYRRLLADATEELERTEKWQ